MTSARVLTRVLTRILPLVLAIASVSAVAVQAQAPWPSAQPQQQAPASAPWPSAQPQQPPASSPWPSAQPSAPMAAPMSAPAPGMGAPAPTAEQQKCLRDFTGYRQEVEKRAKAAEALSKKKPTREQMCELVTAYSAAEAKWIKFSDANMTRCGIPPQAVAQIKAVHAHTLDARKKLCAPGPTQAAAPTAPSLSDALVTSPTPQSDEQTKRRIGGTMDTLTGPVPQR